MKSKYLIISALSIREHNYVSNYSTIKEIRDPLKMIYESTTEIGKKIMNILDQEFEVPTSFKENLQSCVTCKINSLKLLVVNSKIIYKKKWVCILMWKFKATIFLKSEDQNFKNMVVIFDKPQVVLFELKDLKKPKEENIESVLDEKIQNDKERISTKENDES